MAAYARQAKDTAMVEWATEIKVRAERRAGQMLAEMPKAKGAMGNPGGQGASVVRSHDVTAQKTLAEIGITKNESSRWQKLAEMPKAKGGEHYKTTGHIVVPVVNKTLSEIGITKNESSRWQKLAGVPCFVV